MMTVSLMLASMRGMGHWPLMPMTGLSYAPSGFARTHPTVKLWVTVAARADQEESRVNAKMKSNIMGPKMRAFASWTLIETRRVETRKGYSPTNPRALTGAGEGEDRES